MDYAEYLNASDWLFEVNASLPDLAPRPGGPPAPGYVRAPTSGTGWTPAPGPGRDFRRQNYRDPSNLQNNHKILDIMKQCIYTAQRKMIEIDHLVKKYERDPRFRIAYIFNRLDEWKQDMRNVLFSLQRYRYYPRRVKRVIWYYEHMLRLNIDITYSIEALVHLHSSYMVKIEKIMPFAARLNIHTIRNEQRKLKKMKELGLTTLPVDFKKLQMNRIKI